MESVHTMSEVCKLARIDRTTLYRLRRMGRGPKEFRIGRRVLVRDAALREWIAALEQEAMAELLSSDEPEAEAA